MLLGMLFAVFGWFQARRIARPIHALTLATNQIAANKFTYSPPDIKPHGEVAQLAYSIKQMTDKLSEEIHERQAAEEHLRKITEAVKQAAEAIMITDKNGVIEYVNPACCTITGYNAGELIGRTPSILKSDKQEPLFHTHLCPPRQG